MSLSKYIQSPEILNNIFGKKPEALQEAILKKGWEWYADHPGETALIQKNLLSLGFPVSDDLVFNIQMHVIFHYYEKLLPLCGTPQWYHSFIKERVDSREAVNTLSDARKNQGILIAVAHFGAVEFLAPALALHMLPIHSVLRFSTERFSESAKKYVQSMEATGLFGPIRFIEIGKLGTMVALEMAAVLRNREILISVFDEETEYSIPVELFGKQVLGGAGLDRLLRFTNAPVSAFNAFVTRTGNGRYALTLLPIDLSLPDPVQSMFKNLERMVKQNPEQWYFLHEEIPFVQ
jgi:lauroyl/myristoyl acyltransferase